MIRQAPGISCAVDTGDGIGNTSPMNGIIFLTLFTSVPTPIPDSVEGPIDLGTLSVNKARDLTGTRRKFVVWRSSLVEEHEGQKHFDARHAREVHCFIRLVEGQDVPDAERFTIEGTVRVWDVPSYRIDGGRLIEGWMMIRIEDASVLQKSEK